MFSDFSHQAIDLLKKVDITALSKTTLSQATNLNAFDLRGPYTQSLNGAFLTSDGANGIVEIDAALQSFWGNKRMSPDEIWVNSQEARNINKKIVATGGTPLFRFTVPSGPNGDTPAIMGGTSVAKYWNNATVPGHHHPPQSHSGHNLLQDQRDSVPAVRCG